MKYKLTPVALAVKKAIHEMQLTARRKEYLEKQDATDRRNKTT